MPGLIPLVLGTISTETCHISSTRQPCARPRSLQIARSRAHASSLRPVSRIASSHAVIPHTQAEWKRTILEIKAQHLARMYRECFARCCGILEQVRDTTTCEPLHLIYLNFYAASSMEQCARSSTLTSHHRSDLLQKARRHFDRAAALIRDAEASVALKLRPDSRLSSPSTSCHSPCDSILSRSWIADTRFSTPASSVCSFDGHSPSWPSSTQAKAGKKVAFSVPGSLALGLPRVAIRPDSPTLGFEDDYFTAGAARRELPDPPKADEVETELPTPGGSDTGSDTGPRLPDPEDADEMMTIRSFGRYCEHLAGLRSQLVSHLANLDELLAQTISSPEILSRPSSVAGKDLRALDKMARIERLRKNGWQRKRFDASKYEALCDSALMDMA